MRDLIRTISARIKLVHTNLNMDRWRHHLIGYEHAELCQFGFPIGLSSPQPVLVPATSLKKKYLAGPFSAQPFEVIHLSPLMTAEKKPGGRRPDFDTTFREFSLNNGTPSDQYLGQALNFSVFCGNEI